MADLSRVESIGKRSEACGAPNHGQARGYWPPPPYGVNAVELIPISQIIEDHCGPDAASVYLIEAAAAFK